MKPHAKALIVITIAGTMLLQGCSISTSESSSSAHTLATISLTPDVETETTAESSVDANESFSETEPNDRLSVDIDQNAHTFVISYEGYDANEYLEGVILTYDHPDTAKVYRIIPSEEETDPFYNAISEWQMGRFPVLELLLGYEQGQSYTHLSRSEINSVLDSLARIDISDIDSIDTITEAFPDVVFNDYALKETFPAVESHLYQVAVFDESSGEERIADTIIGRNLDHYLIRQSLDGIPIGAPSDVEVEYYYSDDEHTTTTRIINDYYKMYYDGANVYEIFTINNDLENKQEQQTLLSFEQAIDFATPAISDILDEASNNDWEAHIYAAELVYLMVLDSDYIDFGSDVSISHNNDESYLSPFWVIYVHTNQVIRGSECVSRKAILINAITGEVLFSS